MTFDIEIGHTGPLFSLSEQFHWTEPINAMVQQSIAAYGSDEDRLELIDHFSVSVESLETMSLVPSTEVKLAVIQNPSVPPETLVRLTHDRDRFVRAAAKRALAQLPDHVRAAAQSADESTIGRLRARIGA